MKDNQNYNFGSSKLYSLLLFIHLVVFSSCHQKESKHETIDADIKRSTDSITISIRFKEIKGVILNVYDEFFQHSTIQIYNRKSKDTVLYRKISKKQNSQIIFYGYRDGLTKKTINQYLLIDDDDSNIGFDLVNNKLIPVNQKSNVLIDSLINDYSKIWLKLFKATASNKKQLRKKLDTIHNLYKQKYAISNQPIRSQVNDLWYMAYLEYLYPLNPVVDNYVKKTTFSVIGGPFPALLNFYVKNRINTLNYKELDSNFYSSQYIKFLSLGVFKFLKNKDNKGDKQYQSAINWLKTTSLYKKDSIFIKKEITPLNNKEFKNRIKALSLYDTSFKEISFSKLVEQNQAEYYLIDFWATWCGPCIDGINRINKMDIPKHIKVINISTDKLKDKKKWQTKTQELHIKIDGLLNIDNKKNREFLKFIEMTSIPRYILIDKHMNLIDEAFYSPHEPQFTQKLKDIKNWEYW